MDLQLDTPKTTTGGMERERRAQTRGVTPSPAVSANRSDTASTRTESSVGVATSKKKRKSSSSSSSTKGKSFSSSSSNSSKGRASARKDLTEDKETNGDSNYSDNDSDNEMIISLKRKKAPVVARSSSSASKSSSSAVAKPKKAASGKAKKGDNQNTKKNFLEKDPNDRPLIAASDTDSDDEEDRPYRVEYATTGRSTCRSCDQRILKGECRIASRPLFRGKPGFVVYRHLKCQILPPDEVPDMNGVGGWRRLKESDRDLLEAQVLESARLVEQENEDLDADELVQTAFAGEIRPAPPGLSATLLPFQVEGVSWMYNQEVGSVKGGILADEMGMGKVRLVIMHALIMACQPIEI